MNPADGNIFERIWSYITSNVGLKVISVMIAILLWGVVLGSRSVKVTKEIPIEVIPHPDLIVANDIPEKISFELSGPKAFLRTILDRPENPIRIDLVGRKPGNVTYRFFSDNIRLPIGVRVLSITPASIQIRLEAMKRKEVPVRVEFRGVAQEGYKIVKTTVVPERVRIKGADSRLDGVNEIMTTPIDVSGIHQTVEREALVDLSRYSIQLDGPLPKILIEVEPASANFKIKNIKVNVKTNLKYRLEDESVVVLVRADPLEMRRLDASRVFAVVDLAGKPPGRYLENVKITLPDGVGLVRVIPDRVTVLLSP